MKRKNLIFILAILAILVTCIVYSKKTVKYTYNIIQDKQYDAAYLDISIDDFLASGFNFGDSCNVTFSNGLELEDIPFFNGYYVRTGSPLIVGYPGYEYIAVTRNNTGIWTSENFSENDTATVTLNKAGKYKNEQETLSQTYSNDINEYKDEIQFSNFRVLSGGKLKDNFLYRGASPVDNQKNRAAIVNALLEENKIKFILNLADSEEEYKGYIEESDFSSYYASSLYELGNVALLDMSSSYGNADFKMNLVSGLKKMILAEGPMYIHCLEGKDRTGFVCFLLEALAEASYDEMLSDYMKTYDNYYGVTKDGNSEKYNVIASLYFDAFASYLHNTEDHEELIKADYSKDAINYLLDGGMTMGEIEALYKLITKN